MRKFSFLILAALFVAAGCEGCAFPFSTTSQGTIRLSLHKVSPTCETGDDPQPQINDNGTPDDTTDDTILTWEQVPDINDSDESPDCRIGST